MFRLFICCVVLMASSSAFACGACGVGLANFGKGRSLLGSQSKDKKLYFEYLYNQAHFDRMDAAEAHALHEEGHHAHVKTFENYHHFKVGSHITRKFNVALDAPYTIKHSLEVENEDFIGDKQTAQGWADMRLMADYAVFEDQHQILSATGTVQFPTGQTRTKNTAGDLFEPDPQPGYGAFGFGAGASWGRLVPKGYLSASASYMVMKEGDHHFKPSDEALLSAEYDYFFNIRSPYFKSSVGAQAIYQYETRAKEDGVVMNDTGGHVILAGPVLKVRATSNVSVLASVLFPVYQQLGGVHQELAYEWTLGAQLAW